jgi:hypothetical protein
MSYRNDQDAAHARATVLAAELEALRAKTDEALAELAATRAEAKQLTALVGESQRANRKRRRTRMWSYEASADFGKLLAVLLWVTALLFVFTIVYVPHVLLEGRW